MTARGRAGSIRACIVLLAFLVVACAAPGQPSQGSKGTINCAKLASLGVETCPPAKPQLPNPRLTNDTAGQISNKEFKTLVNAYLRTVAYETFALQTNQAELLKAGILSTHQAIQISFGADLQQLAQAESERGYLGGAGPFLTSLRLVNLPSNIQRGISENGYTPTRLGWIATYRAPASSFIVAGSRFTVLYSASSHEAPVENLEWGVLRANTLLGSVWQYGGGTQCSASQLWQTFCENS